MPVELYANSAQTTLAGALTSGATSLTVASSAPFPVPAPAAVPPTQFRARIDAELVIVTAVSGTTWTVTRAAEGTTAAAHSSGATVTHVVTASPLQSLMVRNFGASSEMVLLSDYPGWESTTASVATAARDQAATAAWGGSYTRMLGIPHHPTASGHVWDAPLGYVEGMGMKGLGTSSREFNGAGDVQIQYSGASQFVAWVNGINRFIRFEDLLFSGAQTIPSASQFFVASGAMELRDSEFINCSWKFYQNVFDTPCTRVRIMGETYINNGSGTQLYLRGSDCKLLGEMFIDGYPMVNDQYMVKISLNQSEIDRMYITPAPHMGILFTGTCAGLRARLVINGLTTMLGATGYATTAAFPTASTVTGQLFKANNDIKTYRSNGATYDVFWDGVAPTNVTSLPGSPTQGQLVADTNDDALIRHYRYDGTLWHGPKFHLSSTVASYDGTDGPGVTFQDVKGSLDLDLYIQQTGNYVVSGFRRGAVQLLDCVDEISARIDHDYLNPHSSIYHYDIRDTNLPAGTAVKVRLTDNLGRPHLAGRVDTPRINASGEVQIEYPRRTAQWATRRPSTFDTVHGTTLSTGTVATGTMTGAPYETSRRIDQVAVEVTTAVTSATTRVVLYYDNNLGWPGALAADTGAVATATLGVKTATVDLPPGRYWVFTVSQTAAATLRTFTQFVEGVPQVAAGTANATCLQITGVTGSPPNPFPAVGGTGTPANGATLPIVWLRAV